MIWLILAIATYVLGDLHGQGKFKWKSLGALAGKARDAVFGSRPALYSNAIQAQETVHRAPEDVYRTEKPSIELSPTPPKNPIRVWKAIGNILAFFGGLLAWAAKNPVAVIALIVLALWLTVGASCSGPFGKSKDALRLEREIAEMRAEVAEHQARLEGLAGELAVNTERDRTRRTQVITQAQQEIEDATAQVDPEAQYGAYVRGYLCLLDASTCRDRTDPAPSRTDPVRSSGAHAA